MELIKITTLSSQHIQSIRNLQKLCFKLEDLENEPFLSSELNFDPMIPCYFLYFEREKLIGFLEAFFPTMDEVEINTFVHPNHRGKGIGSFLVEEAKKTYAPLSFLQILFQVEKSSKSGKSFVKHRFPCIDRTEYRMKISKSQWLEKRSSFPLLGTLVEASGEYLDMYVQTVLSLLRENTEFVEQTLANPNRKGSRYLNDTKPIGVLHKYREDDHLSMIYGVAIDEKHRGQGHGKAMLTLALDTFFESCDFLSLEVDTQNPIAFGLYCSLGFEVDFQVDYHSLILP